MRHHVKTRGYNYIITKNGKPTFVNHGHPELFTKTQAAWNVRHLNGPRKQRFAAVKVKIIYQEIR